MKLRNRDSEVLAEPALWRWTRATVYLILFGYAVFAHGCHGDEDHELFGASRPSVKFNGRGRGLYSDPHRHQVKAADL